MASYIALMRKDPDSDYGMEFPDFPGCISAGKTMESVRRMGMEALHFHIAGMIQDGAALPAPSSMEAVAADPENQGAVFMLLDGPAQPARKTVRVKVQLPEDLVERIDKASGNRSRFLADAARAKLGEAA